MLGFGHTIDPRKYDINPDRAFDEAIKAGHLSGLPSAPNFAGLYMYMYTDNDGRHWFKHIDTRHYLHSAKQLAVDVA